MGLMKHTGNGRAVMKTGGAWRLLLAAGDAGGVARGSLTNCFSNKLSYMFALRLALIRAAVSGAVPRRTCAQNDALPLHLMPLSHCDAVCHCRT